MIRSIGVWEAELLVERVRVGCIGLAMVMMLMSIVLSTSLLTLLFLLFYSIVRRLKSVADVLKGIRNKGFAQSRWDALLGFWDAVCRHGPCGPLSLPIILGIVGFLRIFMASTSGYLIPLSC